MEQNKFCFQDLLRTSLTLSVTRRCFVRFVWWSRTHQPRQDWITNQAVVWDKCMVLAAQALSYGELVGNAELTSLDLCGWRAIIRPALGPAAEGGVLSILVSKPCSPQRWRVALYSVACVFCVTRHW